MAINCRVTWFKMFTHRNITRYEIYAFESMHVVRATIVAFAFNKRLSYINFGAKRLSLTPKV